MALSRQVAGREQPGEHRVVLVVVAVLAVAADREEVVEAIEPAPQDAEVGLVVGVVDGVGPGHADHRAGPHLAGLEEADLLGLGRAERHERLVGACRQRSSPWLTKYSRPMNDSAGSSTMSGLQFLKFWTRPTRTSGAVHVDPVVREERSARRRRGPTIRKSR
jgi:hypothetical protein